MTEKEKMLSSKLYNSFEEQLIADRENAKVLCHQFNSLSPSENKKQQDIILKLFGKTGRNFFVTQPFWCDYGYNIEIGDNFYVNHNCVILDCANVQIGNNVLIGPNCGIYTAGHPIDAEIRNSGLEYADPISIGNDVWIGGGVQILPGVKIGNNVVIGSGSVVVKDIPDNVVAVGNPCKVLREITEKDKNIIKLRRG